MTRLLLMSALALLIPLGLGTEPAIAAGPPTPHCSPAPTDCSGWYRTNVTITWTWDAGGAPQDCNFTTISADTPVDGTPVSCSVSFGGPPLTTIVPIRRDATAPQVTAVSPSRQPDSGGWYKQPFSVALSGTDATSGVASCTSPSYGGGDGASLAVSGTCRDMAGNTSAPGSYAFKYDATPPTVSPSVDRPPDGKGWYRKPVTVSFAGTDATSGIAACTAPTRYEGPDQPTATVVGSCRDAAGNAAEAGHRFQYDATAPALAKTEAKVDKGVAHIGWERSGDVVEVELVRSPGINGAKSTIVYRGNGAAFVDKTVKAGVSYRYEISVADIAGNVTTKAVTAATAAKKSTSLLAPVAGAVVKAPPLLRWKPVARATFYNVQLYRNGRKVLSTWPGAAKLRLARTWTYAGKRYRLQPGLYTWYVWGARGTRAKPVYGKVLGSSTFTVKR
jgi:hypothetical protein